MKTTSLILLVSFLLPFALFSQSNNQLTKVKNKYYLNENKLAGKELKNTLNSIPESSVLYKKAKTSTTIGTALVGAGTVVLLYGVLNPPEEEENSLPGLVSHDETMKHLVPVFIGAGVALAGIPFLLIGNKQLTKSVTIYNAKQTPTSHRNELKLNIGLSHNGVGITYRF